MRRTQDNPLLAPKHISVERKTMMIQDTLAYIYICF
jgi:hypothetical protein